MKDVKVGDLVWDCVVGMLGIIVEGLTTEVAQPNQSLGWEWLVLYEDGKLAGADTMHLKAVG